jgi:hypothetical protein
MGAAWELLDICESAFTVRDFNLPSRISYELRSSGLLGSE